MGGTVTPRSRTIYKGTVPIMLLQVQKVVTFPQVMPGPYDIYFKNVAGVQITAVSNVTPNGFTVNIAVSLAGSFDWVAIEQVL